MKFLKISEILKSSISSAIFLALALAVAGCSKQDDTPAKPGSNPLNAPADYVGALAKGKNKALTTVDLAQLNQAIEMFKVQEDRYPKDLDELVASKLINSVPAAPYGKKIAYDGATGKVTIVDAP